MSAVVLNKVSRTSVLPPSPQTYMDVQYAQHEQQGEATWAEGAAYTECHGC